MRTTLDIEDDVLAAAKELARRQRLPAGQVISRLLREALSGTRSTPAVSEAGLRSVAGFQPFASQGVLITDASIDALRDNEGL
jgi:hypothetical protein